MKKFDGLGKSLSKQEQKKIKGGNYGGYGGGGDCSYTRQDGSGIRHTDQGTCKESISTEGTFLYLHTPHCDPATHTGPGPLASNGSTSRCGSTYYPYLMI